MKKYLLFISYSFSLISMQPDSKLITLANGDSKFTVPRDIAVKYSETIKDVLHGPGQEQQSLYVSFTIISPETLKEFSQFLNSISKHEQLREKLLFDAIESELIIKKRVEFLMAAHFLESQSAVNFTARLLAKWAIRKFDEKKGFKYRLLGERITNKMPQDVSEQILGKIASYFYLMAKKVDNWLIEDYGKYFSYTIQDYIDYGKQPVHCYKSLHQSFCTLSGCYLTSIVGLGAIPDVKTDSTLFLNYNTHLKIERDSFKGLSHVKRLRIDHQTLYNFNLDALNDLPHLEEIQVYAYSSDSAERAMATIRVRFPQVRVFCDPSNKP